MRAWAEISSQQEGVEGCGEGGEGQQQKAEIFYVDVCGKK